MCSLVRSTPLASRAALCGAVENSLFNGATILASNAELVLSCRCVSVVRPPKELIDSLVRNSSVKSSHPTLTREICPLKSTSDRRKHKTEKEAS